ncbi:3-isopropylmalate dehydratase small subunit [hydrothermal vent metagenome]|uniref:3-isopropylmalate dehydratase n=1 Tax=hydrothermal vent metagenome TaxID=652676 RepID=A0A3B0VGF0_9ZZZZ
MKSFTTLTSHMVAMPTENIDTDQIIPAQFLKTISKKGLGKNLFYHWRYEENGAAKADFPLNQPAAQGANILLAGDNFGCGSSREHAPWSLMDFGFTAVISTGFADIFRNNSLKNGLLPIVVDAETHQQLFSLVAEDPSSQIDIDLATQTITLPDGRSVQFPIDSFSKTCLLKGLDQLGYLLKQADAIAAYETTHPARVDLRF